MFDSQLGHAREASFSSSTPANTSAFKHAPAQPFVGEKKVTPRQGEWRRKARAFRELSTGGQLADNFQVRPKRASPDKRLKNKCRSW